MPVIESESPFTVTTSDRKREVVQFLKWLDQPRIALRTLPNKHSTYYGWEELEAAADYATGMSPSPDVKADGQNVYLIINDVSEEDFLALANGMTDARAVGAKHIDRRRCFYIDIDPNRKSVEAGPMAANAEEREWAEATCERVLMLGALHGFETPWIVDSGNGYQIYYRIDLPNDETAGALVKRVLLAFAGLFDSSNGQIDTTVHNADRLGRLPGTYNRKGPHTPERPHRLAQTFYGHESSLIAATPTTRLETFCEHVETFTGAIKNSRTPTEAQQKVILSNQHFDRLLVELKTWLAGNGAPPIQDVSVDDSKAVVTFAYCPFRGPTHEDGAAAVIAYRDGGIGFKCFHAKCGGCDWRALQSHLGAEFRNSTLLDHAAEYSGAVPRSYRDPLALAQTHFDGCREADGGQTLVFVLGDMYRYWDVGWRPAPSPELGAWVRGTIQNVYDAEFLAHGRDKKYATAVRSADIHNTTKALESIAYFPINPSQSPPFWLTPNNSSDPLDLLVLRNGFLDLRRWLVGDEHFFPRTSNLFVESFGGYDFDPDRTHAPVWEAFLASLKQDDHWLACLQEIMGCCLWPGYDPQKLFMLIGPPRCGKGTITGMLEGLVGPQNVCSPNLVDFAKPFGLEQAIGKRLAIVPEVAFPSRDTHQVVATLKAITGGDLVTVDRKNLKNIPVRLPMKIVMVTNNFVALPDNSKALPSRLIPVRFTESFLNREDMQLKAKLAEELPAVLNWSLLGLRRLYERGGQFTLPGSSRDVMELMQFESAPLQSFVEEVCILDPRCAIYKQSLYEAYKAWTTANDMDHKRQSAGDFNGQLMSTVPQIVGKRASSRDYQQPSYKIMPTRFDSCVHGSRPEVWVGVHSRQLD